MNEYRLNPDEFIKFAKGIVKETDSEAVHRRIMSGCYFAPKLFAWEYAEKRLRKSLNRIAQEHGQEGDDIGFRIVVANEIGRELVANEEFLYQSRVVADHYYPKMVFLRTRVVSCNREEAIDAIDNCEELVAEIKKKFSETG